MSLLWRVGSPLVETVRCCDYLSGGDSPCLETPLGISLEDWVLSLLQVPLILSPTRSSSLTDMCFLPLPGLWNSGNLEKSHISCFLTARYASNIYFQTGQVMLLLYLYFLWINLIIKFKPWPNLTSPVVTSSSQMYTPLLKFLTTSWGSAVYEAQVWPSHHETEDRDGSESGLAERRPHEDANHIALADHMVSNNFSCRDLRCCSN